MKSLLRSSTTKTTKMSANDYDIFHEIEAMGDFIGVPFAEFIMEEHNENQHSNDENDDEFDAFIDEIENAILQQAENDEYGINQDVEDIIMEFIEIIQPQMNNDEYDSGYESM